MERKNEFRSFFPFLVLFHDNAAIGKFLRKRTKKQDAPLYTVLLKTVYIQRHILLLKNEII